MALTDYKNKKKRILFISSSGGHWIQMRRLESAFEGYEKYYAATDPSYQQSVDYGYFFSVPDDIPGGAWHRPPRLVREGPRRAAL